MYQIKYNLKVMDQGNYFKIKLIFMYDILISFAIAIFFIAN